MGIWVGNCENGRFGKREMRAIFFVKWLERGQRRLFTSKHSITFNNVQKLIKKVTKRLKIYKKSDETFEN